MILARIVRAVPARLMFVWGIFRRIDISTAAGAVSTRLKFVHARVRELYPRIIFRRANGDPVSSGKSNAQVYDDIIQSASAIGDLFGRLGMLPMPGYTGDEINAVHRSSALGRL